MNWILNSIVMVLGAVGLIMDRLEKPRPVVVHVAPLEYTPGRVWN